MKFTRQENHALAILMLATSLLLEGCWPLPLPSYSPEKELVGQSKLESLVGSNKGRVVQLIGEPTHQFSISNGSYYIYEVRADSHGLLMLFYIPIDHYIGKDEVAHCALLEFDIDETLKRYQIDKAAWTGHCYRGFWDKTQREAIKDELRARASQGDSNAAKALVDFFYEKDEDLDE